jgi:hypothetical protein
MMEEIVVYTLDEFKRLKLSGASIGFMMQCTTLIREASPRGRRTVGYGARKPLSHARRHKDGEYG